METRLPTLCARALDTVAATSRRWLPAIAAAMIGAVWAIPVDAQSSAPGGFVELATSTQVRPRITPTLPARGPFTFPAPYNTTGARITNATDCGGGDCVDYIGYSYWRNTNNHVGSNTMLLFVTLDRARGGGGPTLFSYDKTTDQVTKVGPLFDASSPFSWSTGEGWYWSPTQATTLYVNSGPALYRYDVNTKQLETVFDVTATFGSDKYIWQTHTSNDDKVHSATLRSTVDWSMLGCVAYSELTGEFSYFAKTGDFDECQVDKSGRWLLVKEQSDGLNGEDNVILNLETGEQTIFLDPQGAAGHSDNGFGYMIAEDNWYALPGAVRVWSFDQPLPGVAPQGLLAYHTTDWSVDVGHLSHANAQAGLALDQQRACLSHASRFSLPRANEIVCFRLDGSLKALVVAPVMTDLNATGGGSDDYAKLPKGNLDITGQYFIWTSNVGGSRLDAFVVKVPTQLLDDSTLPTVSITAPAADSTVSGTRTVSASATDTSGVAGVQFKLNGVNLGAEVTTPPYSVSWNTTGAADGTYTLTAVARDDAGNTTTSAGVPVAVANTSGGSFSDAFERPDSTLLGLGWQEVRGDLLVKGAELKNTAAKGNHVAVLPALVGATQTAGADFASVSNAAGPAFGVVLRYKDPQNYYLVYRLAGGSSVLRISRFVNGVEKILASASVPKPTVNSFFHLAGRATGTTLTLELNGAQKLSATDPTFASGSPGILLGAGTGTSSQRADNFSATVQ